MTFSEFKNNVELWAAERGIYDHSTTEAQLMKALSELGELADAIILCNLRMRLRYRRRHAQGA